MKFLATLIAVLALVGVAGANHTELGYSSSTTIIESGTDACGEGTEFYNHDGTFENGAMISLGGIAPPYDGAFGESFDLGPVTVTCASFWLSTLAGYQTGQVMDVYAWEGGVSGMPGAVLAMLPGIDPGQIALWAEISRHDVEFVVATGAEFTLGYWPNWPGVAGGWFLASDEDGFSGNPWVYAAGVGWQAPDIYAPGVFIPVSWGVGGYYGTVATNNSTWGSIKSLF